MNITIAQYIEENYPEIHMEYTRYLSREEVPVIGSKVRTLRSGFGGGAGVVRIIQEIRDGKIILSDSIGRRYMSDIEEWYKDFEVMQ